MSNTPLRTGLAMRAARTASALAAIVGVLVVATGPAGAGPLLWVAGNDGTILHSTGDGVWTPQASGITAASFHEIDFIDANVGFTAGSATPSGSGSVLRKTVNGGTTWTAAAGAPPIGAGIAAMDFVDANIGWAGGNPGNAKLYKTVDGGANWTLQLTAGFSSVNDVEFLDASVGWSAQGGAVFYTTNGGATLTNASGESDVVEISFPNANDGWAVSTTGTGAQPRVFVSHDGGASFTTQLVEADIPGANALAAIHFINGLEGWAVGNNGTVLHTSDAGLNWDDRSIVTTADWQDVIFVDALHGWVVGETTIMSTADGGLNWTPELTSGYSGLRTIAAVVPEPSTLILGFSGALLLLGMVGRRRR
jgi:photosystem II stability/assembly factor-like uncharacterized protein